MPETFPLADDVLRISLARRDRLNVYLLGDLLVDAGGRGNARALLRALAGRPVRAHALTHGHFDHQGGSRAVCTALAIPLWCGAGEREAVETGDLRALLPRPRSWGARLEQLLAGPAHPVARVLHEGDVVGPGFMVLETPGHTPGSLSFWRERDRILLLGDLAMHCNPMTGRRGLREGIPVGTFDREAARRSLRRLADLAPAVVCFGHGRPLRNGAAFRRFVTLATSGRAGGATAAAGRA